MGRLAALVGSAVLVAGCSFALAQGAPTPPKQSVTTIQLPPAPKPVLPDAFDGWVQTGKPALSTDPGQVDAASTAALKEYSFTYGETAYYKRDDETLTMRALHFEDTSGAYGAYSFYRQNGWPREDIGTGGTSNHNRVLFWKGDTVVDANYSRVGPMTAGELRAVAAKLNVPGGNRSAAPPVLAFLPQANIDRQTTHYAEGPAGYAGGGGVLPPSIVDFDKGAETATASYSLPSNQATLTIIEYPTPQIAEVQEAAIRKYIQAGSQAQPAWPKELVDSDQASLEVRRSGVLVVLVSGDAIPDESHRLIETVHYEADLTKIPQPTDSEVAKTGRLLLGIATIVIIGSSAAILLGFFLGGGRALWRVAHGRPASSVYDEEFIHLDLRKGWQEDADRASGRNPKG
jgi:hypothetical protein